MKRTKTTQSIRVGLVSLGCAKNLVDGEIMLGSLLKQGIEITNDAEAADALIINTCSFIDAAQEESVNTILESAEMRDAKHRGQAIIVSGCLPQRFRDDLPKLLPEVDAFMGIDQVAQITRIVQQALAHRQARLNAPPQKKVNAGKKVAMQLAQLEKSSPAKSPPLSAPDGSGTSDSSTKTPRSDPPLLEVARRPTYIPDYATPRFRLTPRHFAYVKIAEGCNHPCSFCIIPRMRGSHRSRPPKDIVKEVRRLLKDGVKEINLISQDTTYYGLDLRPQRSSSIAAPSPFKAAARALPADAATLCSLLREINALRGDFWIRLLYTHPAHWTEEMIQTIAECPKVARYIDMPLQHIHPLMLERMRRETSDQYIRELIQRIRHGIPGIALRTTFIVGFPGETETCFRALLDFMQETRFERLGVFAYSKEDDTRAAKMEKQVTVRTKAKRREQAMSVQHEIARQISASYVGRTIKVLVEGKAADQELSQANIFSWEHGLIREKDPLPSKLASHSYLVARGEADAPDIDGRIYVRGKASIGEFAQVRVVGHTDYDLIAEPIP